MLIAFDINAKSWFEQQLNCGWKINSAVVHWLIFTLIMFPGMLALLSFNFTVVHHKVNYEWFEEIFLPGSNEMKYLEIKQSSIAPVSKMRW